jgi:ribonucleotide reductase class II
LLSNASAGWHPPKASRYIRRVTFRKDDPVALAHRDMGFNLVPSQSDKDENGNLLNDPYDSRCTEWLVEIPVEMSWAAVAEGIDISKFSALAQFDFYMQVQKYYATHNVSATIELREHEITDLAIAIHDAIKNNDGYISAALLARFDANETFPRLPFEPISKEKYDMLVKDVEQRKVTDYFIESLNHYAVGRIAELSPSGCDSDACMLPTKK